jgi:predicted ATPase
VQVEDRALINRGGERQVIDALLDAVHAGRSASLVLRGEPGIGRTALLDYAAGRARNVLYVLYFFHGIEYQER